jgi:hypothetical protein
VTDSDLTNQGRTAVTPETPAAATATPSDDSARKEREAEAAAAKAKADARKAAQEAADHDTAAAARQREAEARKKTAEADKDAAAARRAQFAALIPDLSAVKDSTLEVKEGPALWTSFLLGRAVNAAARTVAHKVTAPDSQTRRVLATTDADLATADAVYQDVQTGLEQLIAAADDVLDKTRPETLEEAVEVAGLTPVDTALEAAGAIAGPFPEVAGAIVGAIPAVLSLLSAQRTLSSAAVTATDLAAVAAVAGAMKTEATTVLHEDFRLVPGGGVYALAATVGEKRQLLVARKIVLADKKSALEAELATAKAELDALKKAAPPPSDQAQKVEAALREIARVEARLSQVEARLSQVEVRAGMIDSLLTAADTFLSTIRAVPTGGRRSPLATAALHEQLHGGDRRCTHVLLVKAQAGQAQQMLDNRPLWFEDKFSIAIEISITYMLIETATSGIVASGTESAVQSAHGKIGDSPVLDT